MAENQRILTRRRFVQLASGAALGLGACDSSKPRAGLLGTSSGIGERLQRLVFDPSRLAPQLSETEATPPGAYPQYALTTPFPSPPPDWTLRIGGLVKTPLSLSLQDLARLPRTDVRVRHHCVEGWSAVASWHGVRVSELARAAGASPAAEYVEFRSFDGGYWSSWDAPSALHPQTLVAIGMNGDPLPPGHGAPARLYGGVKLGYKFVKYLTEVNFLPAASGGYWEDLGYDWWAGV